MKKSYRIHHDTNHELCACPVGSGLVLTLMHDAVPSSFVNKESTPFIMRLIPVIVLVLPLMMAYYITVKIVDGERGK